VKHTVSVQPSISPSHNNRLFYPMPCDIRNHVSKAKRTLQLSKLDQENLKLKIEEWQKSTPSSNHFFRSYIKKSDMQVDQDGQTSSSDDVQSSASCDDVPDDCSQTFLCLKMIALLGYYTEASYNVLCITP